MSNEDNQESEIEEIENDESEDEPAPATASKAAMSKKLSAAVKGAEKRRLVIEAIRVVMKTYSQALDFKLTLRMLHYRMVEYPDFKGTGIYENTQNQYKWLSDCLVKARWDNELPWDVFEDKTRDVPSVSYQSYSRPENQWEGIETNVEKILETTIKNIANKANWYSLRDNLYQEHFVIIMLEKQALENVFKQMIDSSKAVLIVNKGYNSLTQLKEFAEILKRDHRKLHLKCFSDFDPTGVDIERNFVEQMKDLGVVFASHERIGLTKELVDKYKLPMAPTKKTDARAKNWSEAGVVELDALDPAVLQQLVKDSIEPYWDADIAHAVNRLEKVLKRRIKKQCDKLIQQIRDQIAT